MPKSATITLTLAGTDTGPFDLLSNVDSFVTPFESNVPKASLIAGYTTNLVPDAATVIRVKSISVSCTNFIDLVYPGITTTTTSTTTSTTTAAPTTTTTTSTTSTTTTQPTTTTTSTTSTTTTQPTTTSTTSTTTTQPTTTTTSTTTTTTTEPPTTTTTSTTSTTTTEEPTTTTSTTTTTTTTVSCNYYDLNIDPIYGSATVEYFDCSGNFVTNTYFSQTTICAETGTPNIIAGGGTLTQQGPCS